MMEWTFVCRGESAGGMGDCVGRGINYLEFSGKAHNPRDFFNPLLLILFRKVQRSRMNRTTKVLVQMLRENIHVHIHEPLIPFVYEFELRGV
jgi:hypothetical protein